MDRPIVYPGALPQDTDILNASLFAMLGLAKLSAAAFGAGPAVAGLACLPTSPASLTVNVSDGSIYAQDEIDASAYGSLGINTAIAIKQGILSAVQSLTITPPATTGFSQVYLVQAALQDVDGGAQVLSYFNSANPSQPFSGPNNSGSSNMTVRQCKCVVALKAGVPATTGTQAAPAPDAGFIGLYTITVANGASQITSDNIAQLASAPFFPTLPQVPYQVQQGAYTYAGQDTGAANAYVITFAAGQPIPTAYTAGMKVSFKAQNACTGASTIDVNDLGIVTIKRASGVALSADDIVSGGVVELTYDGSVFQMQNYLGAGATSNTNTVIDIPYVADTGAQNAIIATFSPAIVSSQQVPGFPILVKLANSITGACTINVNGLGAKPVKTGDLQNPPNGVFVAGEILLLTYDGTQYQIANSTSQIYRKPAANLTIYVNGSIGSDTLYDGTSASIVGGSSTAGPLATIQKAVTTAFGYAPSQFTITISVAAGTYNESVVTPSTAGPALIIDGGSASTTVVSSGGSSCFGSAGPNTLIVKNITVQNSGAVNSAYGFGAGSGATLSTQNTASNGIGAAVFLANNGGTLNAGNHTFNGSCEGLFEAAANGIVKVGGTFTFTTSISMSFATAFAVQGGLVDLGSTAPGPTFVNPSFVSGPKYSATGNGVVNAGSIGGAGNLPGSSAGSASSGGQVF